jgi:ABC-2 type transport system ATP-binding protein
MLATVAGWAKRWQEPTLTKAATSSPCTGGWCPESMMTIGETAIVTRSLTKIYPGTNYKAVDQLDLDVTTGEIFGLLGPNGAGKTTTTGMLTTRVIPTSGSASVGGIDVVREPTLAKQLLGVVSQENTLDRQLTCWENLYFHGRLFGMSARVSRKRADELLERFELTRWRSESVYALSGGMAQRLMVARSIFHDPSVLFLDEPTSGLDPQARLSLWEMLHELNASGQTIVLMTHYMEEADHLCHRVAIMDHGRILALDTPAGLKRTVGAEAVVTVKIVGSIEGLDRILSTEIDGVTNVRPIDGGFDLQASSVPGLLARVAATTERHGYRLADLSLTEPTLETVFINLTGKRLRD